MKSLSTLFKECGDIEAFKDAVIKMNGDFDFGHERMIDLGAAYLEKYPDQFSKRNMDEVHIGYNVVRLCIIEKIIKDIDVKKKEAYRNILKNFSGSQMVLDNLIRTEGCGSIAKDYEDMAAAVHIISSVIDEIPKGMIKERFIGGVTNILNILYLLNMKLKKFEPGPASG